MNRLSCVVLVVASFVSCGQSLPDEASVDSNRQAIAAASVGVEPEDPARVTGEDSVADPGQHDSATARARACSSAELDVAQAHCDAHHSSPVPLFPGNAWMSCTLTSCRVSGPYIIYTY